MAWFRFYDEVADDPKVQRLTPILFRAWVNFMCLAKRNGGILPEVEDLAYGLRVSVAKAKYFHDELKKAELLDQREDGSFEMHNWNGRQFQSDVSTGRVQRFRERQRNVSETANETDQNRTDTEQRQTPIVPKGDFDHFWKIYPRKHGKRAAMKVWNRLKPPCDAVYEAIEAQKQTEQWQQGFIPNPTTWLNQGRWEDEITKPLSFEEREKLGQEHWKTVKANR